MIKKITEHKNNKELTDEFNKLPYDEGVNYFFADCGDMVEIELTNGSTILIYSSEWTHVKIKK